MLNGKIKFNPEISTGNLLTAGTMLLGVATAIFSLKSDVRVLQEQVNINRIDRVELRESIKELNVNQRLLAQNLEYLAGLMDTNERLRQRLLSPKTP